MKYAREGKSKRKDVAENNLKKDQEFNNISHQFPLLPKLRLITKNNHDLGTSHTISPKTQENIFKISQQKSSIKCFKIFLSCVAWICAKVLPPPLFLNSIPLAQHHHRINRLFGQKIPKTQPFNTKNFIKLEQFSGQPRKK